jgi:hypothetical protein
MSFSSSIVNALRGEKSRGLHFELWRKRSARGGGENYLGGEKEARGVWGKLCRTISVHLIVLIFLKKL